jgi:Spx/MgsR family transcriptional regulator
MRPRFLYKSTCSTCRKARALLAELGVETEERDMSRSPLSSDEIRALIGERDYLPFLNFRNEEYRERKMKTNPPSREEAIERMAANPNLVRRPLLILEDQIVFGYDEPAYRRVGS